MKIYEKEAKTIMHETKIPGADWSINHYSGCSHGCVYCYARFICKWRKQKEKWGEFIDVKINAPELAAMESRGKRGNVLLCTTSDPYQPIEKKYRLTRKVIQNLNHELDLDILTKSDLVLDDIYLLKKFKNCEVGLTITTFNDDVRKVFEPHTPSPYARLEALKQLKKAGIHTYCFVGPILPYLTDLEEIFKKAYPFVDMFLFEDLNLDAARKEILEAIKENFPELEEKYKNLSEEFWLEKEEEIKRLGIKFNKPVKIYFKNTGSLKFEK